MGQGPGGPDFPGVRQGYHCRRPARGIGCAHLPIKIWDLPATLSIRRFPDFRRDFRGEDRGARPAFHWRWRGSTLHVAPWDRRQGRGPTANRRIPRQSRLRTCTSRAQRGRTEVYPPGLSSSRVGDAPVLAGANAASRPPGDSAPRCVRHGPLDRWGRSPCRTLGHDGGSKTRARTRRAESRTNDPGGSPSSFLLVGIHRKLPAACWLTATTAARAPRCGGCPIVSPANHCRSRPCRLSRSLVTSTHVSDAPFPHLPIVRQTAVHCPERASDALRGRTTIVGSLPPVRGVTDLGCVPVGRRHTPQPPWSSDAPVVGTAFTIAGEEGEVSAGRW